MKETPEHHIDQPEEEVVDETRDALSCLWPQDMVDRFANADFRAAARMLARGQRGVYVYGELPETFQESEPVPEAERR